MMRLGLALVMVLGAAVPAAWARSLEPIVHHAVADSYAWNSYASTQGIEAGTQRPTTCTPVNVMNDETRILQPVR